MTSNLAGPPETALFGTFNPNHRRTSSDLNVPYEIQAADLEKSACATLARSNHIVAIGG